MFDELIRALDIPAPSLTREPLRFFARSLRATLPPAHDTERYDIYMIHHVIEQIERVAALGDTGVAPRGDAARWPLETTAARDARDAERRVPRVRDALRSSQYAEAIRLASGIADETVSPDMASDLMRMLWRAASSIDRSSPDALQACEQILRLGSRCPSAAAHPDTGTLLVEAAFTRAGSLAAQHRRTEAIAAFGAFVDRYAGATAPLVRERIAAALLNRGAELAAAGETHEALASYDEAVRRFGPASDDTLRELVARVLNGKANLLVQAGRSEEGLATYDALVAFVGEPATPGLAVELARGLFGRAHTCSALGRLEEELAGYAALVDRFGASAEIGARETAARALVNLAFALATVGREEDALREFDTVVQRFGAAPESSLQEAAARALLLKATTLRGSAAAVRCWPPWTRSSAASSAPTTRASGSMSPRRSSRRPRSCGPSGGRRRPWRRAISWWTGSGRRGT